MWLDGHAEGLGVRVVIGGYDDLEGVFGAVGVLGDDGDIAAEDLDHLDVAVQALAFLGLIHGEAFGADGDVDVLLLFEGFRLGSEDDVVANHDLAAADMSFEDVDGRGPEEHGDE